MIQGISMGMKKMKEVQVDIICVTALIPGRGQQDCPFV